MSKAVDGSSTSHRSEVFRGGREEESVLMSLTYVTTIKYDLKYPDDSYNRSKYPCHSKWAV